MLQGGIESGSILVVNRALRPEHRSIVVAEIDGGGFTVKYLHKRADRIKLVPANPTYPELVFRDGQQLIICDAVTAAIKRFTRSPCLRPVRRMSQTSRFSRSQTHDRSRKSCLSS